MGEENEATNTQQSTTESEEQNETALNFLDSVDNYLILIESLTSTLRQVTNDSILEIFNQIFYDSFKLSENYYQLTSSTTTIE